MCGISQPQFKCPLHVHMHKPCMWHICSHEIHVSTRTHKDICILGYTCVFCHVRTCNNIYYSHCIVRTSHMNRSLLVHCRVLVQSACRRKRRCRMHMEIRRRLFCISMAWSQSLSHLLQTVQSRYTYINDVKEGKCNVMTLIDWLIDCLLKIKAPALKWALIIPINVCLEMVE